MKILDHECNWKKRLFSEMLHINNSKKSINKKEDVYNLNNIYNQYVCTRPYTNVFSRNLLFFQFLNNDMPFEHKRDQQNLTLYTSK